MARIVSIIARVALLVACVQLLFYPGWSSTHSILMDARHDVWPVDEAVCVLVIGLHFALLAAHVMFTKRAIHVATLALATLGTVAYYFAGSFLNEPYTAHYVSVALQVTHLAVTTLVLWLPRAKERELAATSLPSPSYV